MLDVGISNISSESWHVWTTNDDSNFFPSFILLLIGERTNDEWTEWDNDYPLDFFDDNFSVHDNSVDHFGCFCRLRFDSMKWTVHGIKTSSTKPYVRVAEAEPPLDDWCIQTLPPALEDTVPCRFSFLRYKHVQHVLITRIPIKHIEPQTVTKTVF